MYKKGRQLLGLTLLLCSAAGAAVAQQVPPALPSPPKGGVAKPKPEVPAPREDREVMRGPRDRTSQTSERSIAIDTNASVKLCVLDAQLKVNGWNRSEMRVFVRDGSRIGIRVLEKSAESAKPVWLQVVNGGSNGMPGPGPECLSGDLIEIDVPMGVSLSVNGRATQTSIDSIKKVFVKNVEGRISLRNIPGGITAATYQGDVTVENSGGAISLESATGNIVAYEVTPGQIGDLFRAKTNSGAISLQRVEHRQIEANSITGSVLFSGKFLTGGLYNFKTSNGAIRLMIPQDSSCTIKASYGFGLFNSELPIDIIQENVSAGGKSLVGRLASGNATVSLVTSSGSIGIRKQ
jgi:hypothetical protein